MSLKFMHTKVDHKSLLFVDTINSRLNLTLVHSYDITIINALNVFHWLLDLDLAVITKVHKPLTDQGLEEIQPKSIQERGHIPSLNEHTGNNITTDMINRHHQNYFNDNPPIVEITN